MDKFVLKNLGFSDYIISEILKIFENLSNNEKNIFSYFFRRCQINDLYLLPNFFSNFFYIKKEQEQSASGIGNGEVLCTLLLKDSELCGLSNGDIKIQNKIYEIKELNPDNTFRLGKSAILECSDFANNFKNLINCLINIKEKTKNQILLNFIDLYFNDLNSLYKMNEISTKKIEKIFEGLSKNFKEFKELNLKNEVYFEYNDNIYLIDQHDANKIKPFSKFEIQTFESYNKFKDDFIFIKELLNNKYSKSPYLFIEDLNKIYFEYFKYIDGLILFEHRGGGKVKKIISRDNFKNSLCTFRITQSKFYPKLILNKDDLKYNFMKEYFRYCEF